MLASLCALAGTFALGVSPASAAFSYRFERTLEAEKPSPGPFGSLAASSVAVNDSSGQTLVADSATGAVDVFETAGEHRQLAVWEGSAATNFPGTGAGSFGGGVLSVAANNGTGRVFVLDSTDNLVDVLSASGEFLCQITGTKPASIAGEERECNGAAGSDTPSHGFSSPTGITVDQASGEVYVLDPSHEAVDVFSLAGAYVGARSFVLGSIPGGFPEGNAQNTRSVAVNDFNGHVYVADSTVSVVYEFTGTGAYVTTWTGGECQPGSANVSEPSVCSNRKGSLGGGVVSVAADNLTGRVYVTANGEFAGHSTGETDVFTATGAFRTQFEAPFHTPNGEAEHHPSGVAVDQATRAIYVSDSTPAGCCGGYAVDVFAASVVPDVRTETPSALSVSTLTLTGTVNPDGLPLTDCHFDWGTTAAYGQSAPCVPAAGEIPADSSEHPVTAHLTGLASGTVYHFRLVAGNANGTNTDEPPQDVQSQTPGPLIADESVSEVSSTSASFAASINPLGHPVSYYFEYATSADFSDATALPAAPGEAIGSGTEAVDVSRHAQTGLAPGTLYYYRLAALAELKAGEEPTPVYGVAQTFTTQTAGALALPDKRAWEMVSPPDKHGAALEGAVEGEQAVQAAAAGGALTYLATGATESEPEGFANHAQILSGRGPQGWETRDIQAPQVGAAGKGGIGSMQQYRLFSSDLSLAALQPFGAFNAALSPAADEQTAYLRTEYAGASNVLCDPRHESCYRPFVTGQAGFANVPAGTHFSTTGDCPLGRHTECGPKFQGATPDFAHVVISSTVALTATPFESPFEREALYEWSAGALKLVSVAPTNGSEPQLATSGYLGRGVLEHAHTAGVVSPDGSRVVWTSTAGHLYLSDTSGATTTAVQLDAELAGGPPVFQAANRDLTVLWFTDEGDLYQYSVGEPGVLQRLTTGAEVQGTVLGAGEDGSRLYFVADAAIPGAAGAVAGQPNLYVRHAGVTSLVAVLSPKDAADWLLGNVKLGYAQTARVSPNGRWLAFMSQLPLTGYDNRDVLSGHPDEEVYLYDGESGRLLCASCNPTGARPAGVESLGKGTAGKEPSLALGGEAVWGGWIAANLPVWTVPGYQPRYLSDAGRLFFNSSDALVPQDVNGTEDVYEWEPLGFPGCTTATAGFSVRSDGCIGLISSGEGGEEAAFLDASESGGDVFFMTANKVLPQDFDTARDVYDAHECTAGSPCLQAAGTAPAACASPDACRPAVSPQPELFGAPSSATFTGPGNLAAPPPPAVVKPKPKPTKCHRGFVKKKVKKKEACVKARTKKHKGKKSDRRAK